MSQKLKKAVKTCEQLLDQNRDHQRIITKIENEHPWKTEVITFISYGLGLSEAADVKQERIHTHKKRIERNLAHTWRVVQIDICGSVITAPAVQNAAGKFIGAHASYYVESIRQRGEERDKEAILRQEVVLQDAYNGFKVAVCNRLGEVLPVGDVKTFLKAKRYVSGLNGYAMKQLKTRPDALNPLREVLGLDPH